jgi:hypothetical protein
MPCKYLMDENVNPLYAQQLMRQSSLTIRAVGEPATPTQGTLDPEILIWCEENQFILVTNNRRSRPVHLADHIAQGRHVPGIFILNPNLTMGENLEELLLIAAVALENEYQDRLEFLPLSY